MTRPCHFLFICLVSGLLAGCSYNSNSAKPQELGRTAGDLSQLAPAPRYVTVTGSKLRYPVDPQTGSPSSPFPVVSYDRSQINVTGAIAVGDSLSILDPRIDR